MQQNHLSPYAMQLVRAYDLVREKQIGDERTPWLALCDLNASERAGLYITVLRRIILDDVTDLDPARRRELEIAHSLTEHAETASVTPLWLELVAKAMDEQVSDAVASEFFGLDQAVAK